MKKFKRLLRRFFRIPVFALLALSALSAMLLGYAFCGGAEETAVAYFSYALSAYTLAVLCVRIPALWRAGRSGCGKEFLWPALFER